MSFKYLITHLYQVFYLKHNIIILIFKFKIKWRFILKLTTINQGKFLYNIKRLNALHNFIYSELPLKMMDGMENVIIYKYS